MLPLPIPSTIVPEASTSMTTPQLPIQPQSVAAMPPVSSPLVDAILDHITLPPPVPSTTIPAPSTSVKPTAQPPIQPKTVAAIPPAYTPVPRIAPPVYHHDGQQFHGPKPLPRHDDVPISKVGPPSWHNPANPVNPTRHPSSATPKPSKGKRKAHQPSLLAGEGYNDDDGDNHRGDPVVGEEAVGEEVEEVVGDEPVEGEVVGDEEAGSQVDSDAAEENDENDENDEEEEEGMEEGEGSTSKEGILPPTHVYNDSTTCPATKSALYEKVYNLQCVMNKSTNDEEKPPPRQCGNSTKHNQKPPKLPACLWCRQKRQKCKFTRYPNSRPRGLSNPLYVNPAGKVYLQGEAGGPLKEDAAVSSGGLVKRQRHQRVILSDDEGDAMETSPLETPSANPKATPTNVRCQPHQLSTSAAPCATRLSSTGKGKADKDPVAESSAQGAAQSNPRTVPRKVMPNVSTHHLCVPRTYPCIPKPINVDTIPCSPIPSPAPTPPPATIPLAPETTIEALSMEVHQLKTELQAQQKVTDGIRREQAALKAQFAKMLTDAVNSAVTSFSQPLTLHLQARWFHRRFIVDYYCRYSFPVIDVGRLVLLQHLTTDLALPLASSNA
ncbi:hypothetical protein JAAARDRAFT_50076 [Jaapia argillacea MUCL 33604]|uniref:Uncharacterized protein n=1 Tax=Jaapia argillacea MUCL 33604 TaxID=933084 RepID=A0A067PNI2_9AGAM|nr:hypothetical protein JAAARDRAFT_50076 [Jaapia argillacea MUCL 33604]